MALEIISRRPDDSIEKYYFFMKCFTLSELLIKIYKYEKKKKIGFKILKNWKININSGYLKMNIICNNLDELLI